MSYGSKLFCINLLIVLVVVVSITVMTWISASRQAAVSNSETLELLTEQALYNFSNAADATGKNIFALYGSTHAAEQMNLMRSIPRGSPEYTLRRRELTVAVARMITASAPYDHASVLLINGDIVTGDPLNEQATREAQTILSQENYAQNTYGTCQWLRMESGGLWCIRDVYCLSPVRRVGKVALRLRQEKLVSIGSNSHYPCNIIFFDRDGQWLMTSGDPVSKELALKASELPAGTDGYLEYDKKQYAVTVQIRNGWRAAGLLPVSIIQDMRRSIVGNGIVAALLGALIGLAVAITLSRRQSRQLRRLAQSMQAVSSGNLDVMIPVESSDDIGSLADSFNRMTQKTKQLVNRVIEEEKHKQQAEYMNLEYKYRFLQWQVNPHFIYNALETVNAHAKIDKNHELSDMIVQLSTYFRANAHSMEKKFITVTEEFTSIGQYVSIYRHIYGDRSQLTVSIAQEAAQALVPTMILQPIAENALIHGASNQGDNLITAEAQISDAQLVISISDRGPGIEQKKIDQLLSEDEPAGSGRTSLGIHNVRERLRLLYGDQAKMDITNVSGGGTRVSLYLPISFPN